MAAARKPAKKKRPAKKKAPAKNVKTVAKRARAQLPADGGDGKKARPSNVTPSPKLLESLSELRAQGIQFLPVTKLKAWAGNPNRHEAGVPRLLRIIQRYGWTIPLVVRTEADGAGLHEISAGHGRLIAAAEELGLEEVPVIYRNFSEHDSHAYGLADNKAPEFSTEDGPALQAVLDELIANGGQQDVFDAGWTAEDLDELAASLAGDSTPPEEPPTPDPPKKPITNPGDVWVMGDHRLMCGDSYSTESIARLVDGVQVSLGLHDPPYGISVVKADGKIGGSVLAENRIYEPVIGDDRPYHPQHLLELGASTTVIWGANYFHDELPRSGAWLAWDKGRPEGTNFSDVELAWTDAQKVAIRCYRVVWHGMIREGESGPRVHPTQKPTKLCAQIVQTYTDEGDVVLDLFGGSGSTLLGCEQVGRSARLMEISPAYCDVIISRWEQMTGGKAKRESANA